MVKKKTRTRKTDLKAGTGTGPVKAPKSAKPDWFVVACAVLALTLAAAAVVFLVLTKKVNENYPWLWHLIHDKLNPVETAADGPKHIMFLFTDHFEPHDQETMERWKESYPKMAKVFTDADGKHPQHSWFWFFSQSDDAEKRSFLRQLSKLSFDGFGEVELHYHHYGDTEQTLTEGIGRALALSNETGALVTAELKPRTTFGFIHGLWGLDNSRGAGACGVDNELIVLRRLGCYADFTHPSWGKMHPRMVNRIYYAVDDPQKPKSYDVGVPMEAGKPGVGDLVIFEGPSVVTLNGWRPKYDHGDVTHTDLPAPERIDRWVEANVHVKGQPNWIFIKPHTHGAVAADAETLLGAPIREMHRHLTTKYNDGKNYVLHYVTAREAYNIAKAAEAGRTGNPNDYRNFVIPPYANRYLVSETPYELISFNDNHLVARFQARPGETLRISLAADNVTVLGSAVIRSQASSPGRVTLNLELADTGTVGFQGNFVSPQSLPEGSALHDR